MSVESSKLWRDFWLDELPVLLITPDGRVSSDPPRVRGVLPGSFNPLHDGHRKLAEIASQILGSEIIFELSVTNVDKASIDKAEVLQRIEQFAGYAAIAVTRAATFLVKLKLFPGIVFVVGYDTAERIVSPRYYTGEAAMDAALREIGANGCGFLVACRTISGELKCLEDLDIPTEFKPLFRGIPAEKFRFDISSTVLRRNE